MNKVIITSYKEEKVYQISVFIDSVFDEFVAPHFSQEGITMFKKFTTISALTERTKNRVALMALMDGDLIGYIEFKNTSHISLFFVKNCNQRKGIGRKLIHKAMSLYKLEQSITVNASPNAIGAYEKMGFIATSKKKTSHGITFIPMKLTNNK